jgi:hypothetical protein
MQCMSAETAFLVQSMVRPSSSERTDWQFISDVQRTMALDLTNDEARPSRSTRMCSFITLSLAPRLELLKGILARLEPPVSKPEPYRR